MSELTAVKLDEIREFADEFRDLIFDLPFQVPQNIIFLARAVGILSGMCTGLDPEFNLWDHLAPYAKKLIADEALSGAKELWTSIERQIRALVLLPARIDNILENLDQGKIALRTPELSKQVDRLEKAVNRLASAIIIGVLLSLSVQLYLNDELYLAIALTVAAAIIVLFTLSATKRNGSS